MPVPDNLVNHIFLGKPITGGINPTLRDRLVAVEEDLTRVFDADPTPVNPITGDVATDFFDWCGILEPHGGFRENGGLHGSGSAIDINTSTNPYIATRTVQNGTVTLG